MGVVRLRRVMEVEVMVGRGMFLGVSRWMLIVGVGVRLRWEMKVQEGMTSCPGMPLMVNPWTWTWYLKGDLDHLPV